MADKIVNEARLVEGYYDQIEVVVWLEDERVRELMANGVSDRYRALLRVSAKAAMVRSALYLVATQNGVELTRKEG